MNLVGTPSEWIGLIDTLVPDILELVTSTWQDMPPLSSVTREDPTTEAFCRLLRLNRNTSELPFQIQIQMVELDPEAEQDQGRMDIAFCPLIPRENIYFCLECKRLNVPSDGRVRSYASEYVLHGMSRFVRGQYAAIVRHGGMLGYVLDGEVDRAMENVGVAVRARHVDLGMQPPGNMLPSSVRPNDQTVRETHHARQHTVEPFLIHHVFVSGMQVSSTPPAGAHA